MPAKRKRRSVRATEDGLSKLKIAKSEKRNSKGKPWTYENIAEAAQVDLSTVKRFFVGNNVDEGYAIAICKALDLNYNDIIEIEETTPPPPPDAIDWRGICRKMLEPQRELASNLFATGIGRRLDLQDIHVPLGLIERRQKPPRKDDCTPEMGSQLYREETETIAPISYDDFFQNVIAAGKTPKSNGQRITIIGEPGAGKTTQLQKIADWVFAKTDQFPVWISLAQVTSSLPEYLRQNWLRDAAGKLDAAPADWITEFEQLLTAGKIWLLLDGADEMGITDPLGNLAQQLRSPIFKHLRVVLSCRQNLWDAAGNALSEFDSYKMLDFSYGNSNTPDQVKQFIEKWFCSAPNLTEPLARANQLRTALDETGKERIKDLARNPLRLSLLCLTWESGNGNLPNTKAELYEVFVEALYELKKGIFPTTAAQRSALNAALGRLALQAIDSGAKSILPDFLVYQALEKPEPELFEQAIKLGWLNRIGVDRVNSLKSVYAFYHPTFQEYFAALIIEDWHFFLPPSLATGNQAIISRNDQVVFSPYRVFEQQWKETILLWCGRTDIAKSEKEAFIKALVDFEDGCNNFYWYRAYFLAAEVINEFRECPLSDEIVAQIVKWGFGEFDDAKQRWTTFFTPIAENAKSILLKTIQEQVINQLCNSLNACPDENVRIQAVKSLGQIAVGNDAAIAALVQLLTSSADESTRWRVAENLGKIDPGNQAAITSLLQLLTSSADESTRWRVAQSLGQIAVGNEVAIAALVGLLDSSANEYTRRLAADSLGQIDPGNEAAITALVQLLDSSANEYTRALVAHSLEKIAVGSEATITALLQLLKSSSNESALWRVAQILGQIDPGNEAAIPTLLQLLHSSADEDIRWLAADCLGHIDPGNKAAVSALLQLLHSSADEDTRWRAAQSLDKIAVDKEILIAALVDLLESSVHEFTRWRAANSLGEIDSGNEAAIAALVQLLESSVCEFIRWRAADSLGKIDPGNAVTIPALVQLLGFSADEFIRWLAADSLGKIDPGNEVAIAALVQLLDSSADEGIRWQAADSLGKISPGNAVTIASLLTIFQTSEDEYNLKNAAGILLKIFTTNEHLLEVISTLNPYLSKKVYENHWYQFEQCFRLIWHCAQNLSYPDFYYAWHFGKAKSAEIAATIHSLNLSELPARLHTAIDTDPACRGKVQLICIDGSKFIDRDNPAGKIYTAMVKQGCPKCDDGTPKTMADLQTYWDLLPTDPPIILVFYEDPTAPAPQGFSETFLNALSKFDGTICVITESANSSLQSFSPHDANLLENICKWIGANIAEK